VLTVPLTPVNQLQIFSVIAMSVAALVFIAGCNWSVAES